MLKLLKAFLRHHHRRPLPTLLWIFGVALGVTMVSGIYLANQSALNSFTSATKVLSGRATHELSTSAGLIDEKVYTELLRKLPGLKAAPLVEGELSGKGQILTLVGIDPFAARELNPLLQTALGPEELLHFVLSPQTVLASPAAAALADNHNFLHLDRGGRNRKALTLEIIKTVDIPENPEKAVIFGDISWTQALLQGPGKLKKIELVLTKQANIAALKKLLPAHLQLTATAGSARLYTAMLDSFSLNLTALSLLSLFVGFYLVYNTILFSLLQRRREIGILLTLGFSRNQISAALLLEISLIAAVGSLIGLALGYLLAGYSLNIINRTISDLYFFLRSSLPRLSPGFYIRGLLVGIGSAWAAAFFPLLEIRRNTILTLLSRRQGEDRTFRHRKINFLLGLTLTLSSMGVAYLPAESPFFGFAAAFGVCLGTSLLAPFGIDLLLNPRLTAILPNIKWRLAIGTVRRSLSRSAPAVAALMVALSMSLAISLMIGSFRETVTQWFANSIQGDYYITDSDRDYDASRLDAGLIEKLLKLPEVAAGNRYRNLRYQFNERLIRLTGVDSRILKKYSTYHFTAKTSADPWLEVSRGAVMISETLARKHRLAPGQYLTLNGIRGQQQFKIAAIFRDYITEHGVILMDFSNLQALMQDDSVNSLALFLKEGTDTKTFARTLQEMLKPYSCKLFANHDLKQRIMEIFDRSFAITLSTRMIAILVAFFGIISALLAIYMENEREYGILRALGLSRKEVFAIALGHSLTLGLLAVVGAGLSGPLLAWILVKVINLKSFGWSIDFSFDLMLYPATMAITVAASLAAGLYPAWRISATQPSFQMRER
ncbi:MAG: FtsX-like permease family protein [Deltaproteobacteria bacterium]|nr:FtsX-like permease family protein [Deltaproteobacteria bacterium]